MSHKHHENFSNRLFDIIPTHTVIVTITLLASSTLYKQCSVCALQHRYLHRQVTRMSIGYKIAMLLICSDIQVRRRVGTQLMVDRRIEEQ